MADLEKIIIENTTVLKEFEEHLKIPTNKRILFTGPFGSGKSYFLKEFFTSSTDYLYLNLYPVDYSVASNTDILEIIKHDIVSTLLKKYEDEIQLQENDFSKFSLIQSYILHKLDYYTWAKKLLSGLIPGASNAFDAIDATKDVLEKYADNERDLTTDEVSKVADFIASIRNTKGSIREEDEMTEMVKDFLNRIKMRKESKSFVLVIDDLDRLDPDHIFRLINIFTAHFDSQEEKNKFGFDQVILVCDINSLRHMFKYRYGNEANFNGYIDKFYSVKPFVFDNKRHLKDKIDSLIKNKKQLLSTNGSVSRQESVISDTYGQHSDFYVVFKQVLIDLIDLDILKIRNFDRFENYTIPKFKFKNFSGRAFESYNYEFLFLLHQLKQFFATKQELRSAIKNLSDNFSSDYTISEVEYFADSSFDKYLIQIALPFVVEEHVAFSNKRPLTTNHIYMFLNEYSETIYVKYQTDGSNDHWNSGISYILCSNTASNNDRMVRPNIYMFMLKAIDNCDLRKIQY